MLGRLLCTFCHSLSTELSWLRPKLYTRMTLIAKAFMWAIAGRITRDTSYGANFFPPVFKHGNEVLPRVIACFPDQKVIDLNNAISDCPSFAFASVVDTHSFTARDLGTTRYRIVEIDHFLVWKTSYHPWQYFVTMLKNGWKKNSPVRCISSYPTSNGSHKSFGD